MRKVSERGSATDAVVVPILRTVSGNPPRTLGDGGSDRTSEADGGRLRLLQGRKERTPHNKPPNIPVIASKADEG